MKHLNIKIQSSDCCLNQRVDLKSKSPHGFGGSDGFPGPLSQASLPLTRRNPAPSFSPPSNSYTHRKIHPTQSWMEGYLRHPNVCPEWCVGGNQCPSGGQLGFCATRQLTQALLLSVPSSYHHRRKERQVKSPTGSQTFARKVLCLGVPGLPTCWLCLSPLSRPTGRSRATSRQTNPGVTVCELPRGQAAALHAGGWCTSRDLPYQGQLFALLLRFCLRRLQLLLGL